MVNLTIMVRDRLNLTRQTLDSLAQSGALEGNTLTILDDRSQDATWRFLVEWSAQHGAYLCRNEAQIGTGELRNRVIKASENQFGRGTLLYLSDNDLAYSKDWLNILACSYVGTTPPYSVIGAYNHPFNQPITYRYDAAYYSVSEVLALASQSMLMSWYIWDKYGPFVQTPIDKVCQSEDVEFTNRIRADGKRIGVMSPWLAIGTGITNTFGEPIPGWELVKSQCPEGILCE